jgi:hypothetical protein
LRWDPALYVTTCASCKTRQFCTSLHVCGMESRCFPCGQKTSAEIGHVLPWPESRR